MQLHHDHGAATATQPGSLDASDDYEPAEMSARYCPGALLNRFTLLMAGHGRCVSTAMMLGDREYALWQLACARALGDADLDDAADRLSNYFVAA
jgi:hypothetical protein